MSKGSCKERRRRSVHPRRKRWMQSRKDKHECESSCGRQLHDQRPPRQKRGGQKSRRRRRRLRNSRAGKHRYQDCGAGRSSNSSSGALPQNWRRSGARRCLSRVSSCQKNRSGPHGDLPLVPDSWSLVSYRRLSLVTWSSFVFFVWIFSTMCLLAHANRSRRGSSLESPTKKLKQIERLRFENKGKDRKGHHANGACTSKGAVKRRRRANRKEQGEYSKHWPCGKSTTDKIRISRPKHTFGELGAIHTVRKIYPNPNKG